MSSLRTGTIFQMNDHNIKQAQMCSYPPKRNRYDRWNHRQTDRSTVRLTWTQMWTLFYSHAWWNHPKILIGHSNGLCTLPPLWLVSLCPYTPSCSLIGQSKWAHIQPWWNSMINQNSYGHTHWLTSTVLSPPFSAGNKLLGYLILIVMSKSKVQSQRSKSKVQIHLVMA